MYRFDAQAYFPKARNLPGAGIKYDEDSNTWYYFKKLDKESAERWILSERTVPLDPKDALLLVMVIYESNLAVSDVADKYRTAAFQKTVLSLCTLACAEFALARAYMVLLEDFYNNTDADHAQANAAYYDEFPNGMSIPKVIKTALYTTDISVKNVEKHLSTVGDIVQRYAKNLKKVEHYLAAKSIFADISPNSDVIFFQQKWYFCNQRYLNVTINEPAALRPLSATQALKLAQAYYRQDNRENFKALHALLKYALAEHPLAHVYHVLFAQMEFGDGPALWALIEKTAVQLQQDSANDLSQLDIPVGLDANTPADIEKFSQMHEAASKKSNDHKFRYRLPVKDFFPKLEQVQGIAYDGETWRYYRKYTEQAKSTYVAEPARELSKDEAALVALSLCQKLRSQTLPGSHQHDEAWFEIITSILSLAGDDHILHNVVQALLLEHYYGTQQSQWPSIYLALAQATAVNFKHLSEGLLVLIRRSSLTDVKLRGQLDSLKKLQENYRQRLNYPEQNTVIESKAIFPNMPDAVARYNGEWFFYAEVQQQPVLVATKQSQPLTAAQALLIVAKHFPQSTWQKDAGIIRSLLEFAKSSQPLAAAYLLQLDIHLKGEERGQYAKRLELCQPLQNYSAEQFDAELKQALAASKVTQDDLEKVLNFAKDKAAEYEQKLSQPQHDYCFDAAELFTTADGQEIMFADGLWQFKASAASTSTRAGQENVARPLLSADALVAAVYIYIKAAARETEKLHVIAKSMLAQVEEDSGLNYGLSAILSLSTQPQNRRAIAESFHKALLAMDDNNFISAETKAVLNQSNIRTKDMKRLERTVRKQALPLIREFNLPYVTAEDHQHKVQKMSARELLAAVKANNVYAIHCLAHKQLKALHGTELRLAHTRFAKLDTATRRTIVSSAAYLIYGGLLAGNNYPALSWRGDVLPNEHEYINEFRKTFALGNNNKHDLATIRCFLALVQQWQYLENHRGKLDIPTPKRFTLLTTLANLNPEVLKHRQRQHGFVELLMFAIAAENKNNFSQYIEQSGKQRFAKEDFLVFEGRETYHQMRGDLLEILKDCDDLGPLKIAVQKFKEVFDAIRQANPKSFETQVWQNYQNPPPNTFSIKGYLAAQGSQGLDASCLTSSYK